MSDPNGDLHFVDQSLEILLEDMVLGVIATTAIAKNKDRVGVLVNTATMIAPPRPEVIAGKFTGVVTGTQSEMSDIAFQVVKPVGNHQASGVVAIIMIPRPNRLITVSPTRSKEIAQKLLLFGIHAKDRIW